MGDLFNLFFQCFACNSILILLYLFVNYVLLEVPPVHFMMFCQNYGTNVVTLFVVLLYYFHNWLLYLTMLFFHFLQSITFTID